MLANDQESLVDTGRIYVKAGDGGNGSVSFRREKYIPYGGPDGGDGGRGGHVFLRASNSINTLYGFKHKKRFLAQSGESGQSSNMAGKKGKDLVIRVPVGTIVYNADSGEIIADLCNPGQTIVIARGGKGGRGNARFVSSTNQAPKAAENGEPGEELFVRLELKILADVALVGFPNVGKSTLISTISNARPKIANYHFTTLSPNLGVVMVSDSLGYIVADVPGLIKGAHEGIGLGHTFLRHIERCKTIVHLLDISESEERDFIQDYIDIRYELEFYKRELADKPEIVVANKCDLITQAERQKRLQLFKESTGKEIIPVSAASHEGIQALKEAIWRTIEGDSSYLSSMKADEDTPLPQVEPVVLTAPYPEDFRVEKDSSGRYVVLGPAVDFYVRKIRAFKYRDRFIMDKLEKGGLSSKLRDAGIMEGDTVVIDDREYVFRE
ncbi:GTPase ObgE [Mesotoga prima]|uniref:GTPase ObgE n=1 Tax=Mesotoga prima TaxID=1184387 RepID=UPI002C752B52|nr:GTPase ObgE [Mesotoga prima]HNS76242.1 GTPase ObgE [Mesotoga prima]